MGKWIVIERADRKTLFFVDDLTRNQQLVADLKHGAADDIILMWMMDQGALAPGDVIALTQGRTLCVSKEIGLC